MASRSWFWVKVCPRAEACSEQAFKRAKVWGWTEQEARDRLSQHLQASSLHEMSEEDAKGIADGVDLEEAILRREEATHVDEQAPPPVAPPVAPTWPKAPSPVASSATSTAAIVAETLRQAGLSPATPTSSPGTTLDIGSRVLPPPQNDTQVVPATNVVRRADLVAAVDALKRAQTAARQAHRLSLAAAEAFNNEAQVFQESQGALESILRR